MKEIKYFLLFVTLFMLFVGVVSAADISDNLTSSKVTEDVLQDTQIASQIDTIADEMNVNENLETDTNPRDDECTIKYIHKNEGINSNLKEDVSVSSWMELVQKVNEATSSSVDTTITLTNNLVSSGLTWQGQNSVLTIDGNGKEINGNNKQVFNIARGSTLILKNITIMNAKSSNAAIYNNGNLIIIHSTLKNNNGDNNRGGAIYNMGTLTINDSSLNDNTANIGGAVFNLGTLNISYSNLIGNNAISGGGAIENGGILTIINTTLNNNKAQGESADGGAISSLGKINIINSTLDRNTAQLYGGAISINSGTVNITNSTLNYNTAKLAGGAILSQGETLTLDNSTLNGNILLYDGARGGAIFSYGQENKENILTIINSTLNENNAGYVNGHGRGGAIFNDQFTKVIIINSTLNYNNATEEGGAILNRRALFIQNSTLSGNLANGSGGAVFNKYNILGDVTFNVHETFFIDNHASSGAAIGCEYGVVSSNITNCSFINNTANDRETIVLQGERILNDNVYDSTDISIKTLNLSVNEGPDCFIEGENIDLLFAIVLEHPEYYDNDISEKINKTLFVNGYQNTTVNDMSYTLSNIMRGEYNIYFTVLDSESNRVSFKVIGPKEISIDNYQGLMCGIEDAKSEKYSSYKINLLPGDYDITSTIILDGSETKTITINGNGNSLNGQNTYQFIDVSERLELTIENITISNCKATYGGAISNSGANITILNSTLEDNYATTDGGAISNSGGIITILNSTLKNNTADVNGGAVYNDVELFVMVSDSYFIENHANCSAAVFSKGYANLTNNYFVENSANDGETLYIGVEHVLKANSYNSTDILLKTMNLVVKDNQKSFREGEDVTLNFTIELENPNCYDDDILERLEDIRVYINGLENVTTGYENYTLSDLKAGEYIVYFNSCNHESNTITFMVIKETKITLDPISNVKYRSNITISGRLIYEDMGLSNQIITLIVCEKEVNVTTVDNGLFEQVAFFDLIGKQNVTAVFAGMGEYGASENVLVVDVNRKESEITLNNIATVTCNDNVTISGLVSSVDGTPLGHVNVYVYLNGEEQHVTTYRTGMFKATFTTATVGQQDVLVVYNGNSKYLASNASAVFTATSVKLVMFTVKPVTYRDTYTIQGKLTDTEGNVITGAEVKLTINDETITLTTDKNGRYTYKAQALKLGNFTVTASYIDEATATELTATKILSVSKRAVSLVVDEIPDASVGSEVTITGKLTDDAGTAYKNCNIYVKINGEEQHVYTDTKGIFTYAYTPTSTGTQNVEVVYKGNSNYLGDKVTTTFVVNA